MSLISSVAEAVGVSVAVAEELLGPESRDWDQQLNRRDGERAVRERLPGKIERDGMSTSEAALHLGLTEESFRAILANQPPHLLIQRDTQGEPRFLKEDLDAFLDPYLPRFKTWGNRTSMIREFVANLQGQTGVSAELQFCETAGCEHLAWVQCANPTCRVDESPRKVCGRHSEFLRDLSGRRLCASCVRRVLFGDLRGAFEIAGTRSRLEREYQDGQGN